MSSRLKASHRPPSKLQQASILTESIPAESIYSESNYPLKKLSRYSRSPQKSHAPSNNSHLQSHYEPSSRRKGKQSYKSSQQSYYLDQPEYQDTVQRAPYSDRHMRSQYSELVQQLSTKQLKDFKKAKQHSKLSSKYDYSQEDGFTQRSRQSKTSRRKDAESFRTEEADYESYLRERYPDMVHSARESLRNEGYSQTNPSFRESQQVHHIHTH